MVTYKADFTSQELIKLIFYKKVCPYCKFQLEKVKEKDYLGKTWHEGLEPGSITYGKQYRVRISYYCNQCNRRIDLQELKYRRNFFSNSKE